MSNISGSTGSGKDGWPAQVVTNSNSGKNSVNDHGPGMPRPQPTRSEIGKNSSKDPGPGMKRDHPGNCK